jgi:hypothetical protein
MEVYWGSRGIALRILDLGIRWSWVVSFKHRNDTETKWKVRGKLITNKSNNNNNNNNNNNKEKIWRRWLWLQIESYCANRNEGEVESDDNGEDDCDNVMKCDDKRRDYFCRLLLWLQDGLVATLENYNCGGTEVSSSNLCQASLLSWAKFSVGFHQYSGKYRTDYHIHVRQDHFQDPSLLTDYLQCHILFDNSITSAVETVSLNNLRMILFSYRYLRDLRFSRRWRFKSGSSGLWRHVVKC